MWRFKFTNASIDKAKEYLKTGTGRKPAFFKSHKGTVKNGKLYLDDLKVVPSEKIHKITRDLVLSGKVPLTRDALYHYLSKQMVGVRRAVIDKVLKAQRVIRETDNNKPKTTRKPRRVNKRGQIAFDLIDVRFADLGFVPRNRDEHLLTLKGKSDARKFGYIFSCAEQLTGLTFCEWVPAKYQKYVTPIARRCFNWMAKQLDIPISKMFAVSDKGDEFAFKLYKKWGLRHKTMDRASLIEAKNAHIQRVLYRIAKMGISRDIKELLKMTQDVVNNTKSSLTKVTPNEAEAYKGKTWSRKAYPILQTRGNTYKIDGPKGKKFYHADNLKLTNTYDAEADRIVASRKKVLDKKAPEKKKFPKITSVFKPKN